MDNGKNNIIDIFSRERFFIIPSYQRSYSWEEKQQRDFYEDFKSNYYSTNYYYGTILLQRVGNEDNKYEIVDGQQRITTLTIFMYCLLKELKARKEKDTNNFWNEEDLEDWNDWERKFIKNKGYFKLTLQKQDTGFFHECILDEEGEFTVETPSQKRLMGAKKNFTNWLKDASVDTLKNLTNNISHAKALVYIIENRKEASLIFETTNDRGKVLTNLEKIKSYLMYKVSSTLKKPEQLLLSIENAFDKIYRDFEKVEEKKFDEDSILQYNFIANEVWINEGGKKSYQHYMEVLKDKIENLIKKEMDRRNKNKNRQEEQEKEEFKEMQEYIRNYITNVQNSYDHISQIFIKPVNELKDLNALGRMASFYPLLLKSYKFDKTEQKELFKKICSICEIFSFRIFVILKYASNKYQTKFYELARDFGNDKNCSEEETKKQFNKLFAEIASLAKSLGNDDKFLEEIADKDFYNKYAPSDRNYFFWKYENYLRENKQPTANSMPHEDLWSKGSKKLTIEHIVAQGNKEEQQKIITLSSIIDVGDEETFNKEYMHCIGNLTIDPLSANASKSNKDVEEKNSIYFKKAPYKSQNELEDFLEEVISETKEKTMKWTVKSIKNRREALIKFAKETWCDPLNEYKEIQVEVQEDDDSNENMINIMEEE